MQVIYSNRWSCTDIWNLNVAGKKRKFVGELDLKVPPKP